MGSEVLTIDEVATLLRVSTDTIYRLANRGELAGRKVGRIWRIPRAAVEQYLRCPPRRIPASDSSTAVPVVSTTSSGSGVLAQGA
jgi:excisionase family DNA binding protein